MTSIWGHCREEPAAPLPMEVQGVCPLPCLQSFPVTASVCPFSAGITGQTVTIKPFALSPGKTYVLQASVGMLRCQLDLVGGMMRGFIAFMFFLEISASSESPELLSRVS